MEITFGDKVLADPQSCRCFVTHHNRDADWSDLARFGHAVIPIFSGKTIFPDTAERSEESLPGKARLRLDKNQFNPEFDYVVLAGDILVQAAIVAIIARHYGDFTALRFDRREQRYWPYKVATLSN